MRMRLAILAVGLALAQQPPTKPRFEAAANLVVVDVTVRDRAGNPVEGLKKEDFTVIEDGKPQAISVFEFQKLALDRLPRLDPASVPVAAAPAPDAPQEPGAKPWYQDRRLLALFFDLSGMPPADLFRAQDAALKFLDEHMTEADLVSVMSFSTRLRILQDFTGDRDKLARIIRGFTLGETAQLEEAAEAEDPDADPEALAIDETEFNIFNTDRKLSALESAASRLRGFPARKALVYFSSGVGRTGVENQSQLRATINAAVRSNVSFYPIDARGLTPLPPGGGAAVAAPRGTSIFSGQGQRRQRERFDNQQETLFSLAAETGGKALLDTNELSTGIVDAQRDFRSYYILGYYSTNAALDGRFRRIQVKLAPPAQARLEYRRGYYAGKDFSRFTADDKERQLAEALALGAPVTDLPMALEVNYFRLGGSRYFVPVAVKIPGSAISLKRRGGHEETELDFIGEVRDAGGRPAGAVRDGITVKLTEANAAQLGRRHLQYDTGFMLAPGAYKLRFLARENRSGKMGAFETAFTVPDLSAESAALRMSSVVWSSQREPLASAVGAADRKDRLLEFHPLVRDGHKLIPSITRVFRRDQNLHVYFEVYDPAADGESRAPAVAATVSFFQGNTKVFESPPVEARQPPPVEARRKPVRAREAPAPRTQALPVQFQIPLKPLAAGAYTCQVNVVDEAGRKFSFPRARLVLLP